MKRRNIYLVADGIGGTGKDTVLEHLAERFGELGYGVVTTFEPGGTLEANRLRDELFRRKANNAITPEEELDYVFVAREINMREIVLPALERPEPTVVLKARDYMSSFIYQVASGADRDLLLSYYRKHYEGNGFPKPDLRLLLLLDPKTAMRRRMGVGSMGDGFDLQPDEYWERVATGYYTEAMDIAKRRGLFRQETVVVDAGGSKEQVRTAAWDVVGRRFGLIEENTESHLTHGRRNAEGVYPRSWRK